MARFFHHDLPEWWRKMSTVFLAFSWLAGLVSGIFAFSAAGDTFLPLMRSCLYGSVSIISLLCVTILPFLFSTLAVYVSEPWLLLAVSFGKAFLFSLIAVGISVSFGSAGWLMRLLLMFSDFCVLPLLYWFWLRHISGQRVFNGFEIAAVLSLFVLIGSVDYCVISPFLASLISF